MGRPNRRSRTGFGAPLLSYPTPNVEDVLIIDEQDYSVKGFEPVLPGTPRPNDPTALLLLQRVVTKNDQREVVQSIYASPRNSSQDSYNDDLEYDGEHLSYPIYIRDYIELRSSYAPRAYGQPLTSIIKVVIDDGGSGYTGDVTATIDGTGTGATVAVEVRDGVIIAAYVTNGGEGYYGTPTITFGGTSLGAGTTIAAPDNVTITTTTSVTTDYTIIGTLTIEGEMTFGTSSGSGATGRVFVQEFGAVLISQKRFRMDGELGSIFVRVRRIYATLPGAEQIRAGYDQDTLATTYRVTQVVAAGADKTPLDEYRSFGGVAHYCVDSSVEPQERSSVMSVRTTLYMKLPTQRVVRRSGTYSWPAIAAYISGWSTTPAGDLKYTGPFPGVHFLKTGRRTAAQFEQTFTYSIGPNADAMPEVFTVVTPGDADRFMGIGANTIHNAIVIVEDDGGGNTQVIESLPASSPSSYTRGDVKITGASERKIAGNFWERVIETAYEPTPT